MLHVDKKIIKGFIVLLLCISCDQTDKSLIQDRYEIALDRSLQIVGPSVYHNVLKSAEDSMDNWIKNKIPFFARFKIDSVRLDSLVCFNRNGTKAIMARLSQCRRDCAQDDIHFFYGVKIKENWYFFSGATIVLARENYQKDVHAPLPFTKLHEIAMQEVFRGYLKKKDLGFWRNVFGKTEYEVNEAFFNQLDYSKWAFFDINGKAVDNSKLTQAQLDSHLLAKAVFSNWKIRDTTDYKP
jgi:hypothetical protein